MGNCIQQRRVCDWDPFALDPVRGSSLSEDKGRAWAITGIIGILSMNRTGTRTYHGGGQSITSYLCANKVIETVFLDLTFLEESKNILGLKTACAFLWPFARG